MGASEGSEQAARAILNPKVGRYDVEADIGPAYATRRQEAFNAYSQIVTANRELTAVIGDIVFRNLDTPGADEVADRLKRALEHTQPWILGKGEPPSVAELRQQVKTLSAMSEELMGKLAAEQARRNADMQSKEIDVHRAETDRFRAVIDALSKFSEIGQRMTELQNVFDQTMQQMQGLDLNELLRQAQEAEAGVGQIPATLPGAGGMGAGDEPSAHSAMTRHALRNPGAEMPPGALPGPPPPKPPSGPMGPQGV
jgi:signal transduction histidine kinase